MNWLTMEVAELENRVLEEISGDEIWRHAQTIAQWKRYAGSEDEARAFDYIKTTLLGFGCEVNAYEFDSLVGIPESASLEIIAEKPQHFDAISHGLVPSTPPEGIAGELIYVGRGNRASYEGDVDVNGKIVLVEGLGSPYRARLAEDNGALAQIFINDEHTHDFAISTVWGTPTPETASLLQKSHGISVKKAVGDHLKGWLDKGPVTIRLRCKSDNGWKKIPVLTGEFKPAGGSDRFVLFSGHVDSWHFGAMDNAGANAAMMELIRVLSRNASNMRRGLRVAFWSGHSQGRYSGSTWYADNFWEDLHENCIAHVNIDSIGGKGATRFDSGEVMAETRTFAADVIKKMTGQDLKGRRIGRAGDQSFWGCGLPSVFVSLSEQPPEDRRGGFAGGLGWWWHTPEDTIDKLDKDNLARDARIYAEILTRLYALPALPFDFGATGEELETILTGFQKNAKGVFDMGSCLDRAEQFKKEAIRFGEVIDRIRKDLDKEMLAMVNDTLMKLGRILIPINYTGAGQFDQDPAVPIRPVPVLYPVTRLTSMNSESDGFRFLYTRLIRERNKVSHALKQAAAVARDARVKLEKMGF